MQVNASETIHRSAFWFVIVGGVAAAVHWLVVLALVESGAWRPLLANVVGWLTALGVSFGGHYRLSFRGHGATLEGSAARFVLVSASGFAVNETAYAVLLRWSGAHYGLLLGAVLVSVAFATWWLSRHWVFLRSRARP